MQFKFFKKQYLGLDTNGDVEINDINATQKITELCESLHLGRSITTALNLWKGGVFEAVKNLIQEISLLDIKDFAHILRHRFKRRRYTFCNLF